jgi:hypothetical protein
MQTVQEQSYKVHRAGRVSQRKRVHAAFRASMRAVDAKTAHVQTKAFYRSGRAEWTQGLD